MALVPPLVTGPPQRKVLLEDSSANSKISSVATIPSPTLPLCLAEVHPWEQEVVPRDTDSFRSQDSVLLADLVDHHRLEVIRTHVVDLLSPVLPVLAILDSITARSVVLARHLPDTEKVHSRNCQDSIVIPSALSNNNRDLLPSAIKLVPISISHHPRHCISNSNSKEDLTVDSVEDQVYTVNSISSNISSLVSFPPLDPKVVCTVKNHWSSQSRSP
jgi:hypothetical protein